MAILALLFLEDTATIAWREGGGREGGREGESLTICMFLLSTARWRGVCWLMFWTSGLAPWGRGREGGEGGREGGEERGGDTLLPNSPAIMRVRLLLDHSLLC